MAAFFVRRVLGVPVGWPRSTAVGLLVCFGGVPLANVLLAASGITTPEDVSANLGATLLLGALSFAWAFAFGIGILVVTEVLWPTGSIRSPWVMIKSAKASRARHRRYLQVMRIAFAEGLLRPTNGKALREGSSEARRAAQALSATLSRSGVTFIKLGQMLSTRAESLPSEFVDELSKLQTRAEPEAWANIEPALVDSMGKPLEELFESINTSPLASASVAQVHSAVLSTGESVVLKVQRPSARDQVKVDLDIIERFARLLERRTAWGRTLGMESLAAGFGDSLREELDYGIEAENMRAIAAAAPSLKIPKVFGEFSSDTILVMEYVEGTPLGEADLEGLDSSTRHDLASELLAGILHQVVVSGVFHADLHPGNILIQAHEPTNESPTDHRSATLALLDFGSVGRLGKSSRLSLAGFIAAVHADDNVVATDRLLEMMLPPRILDRRVLENDMGVFLTYVGGPTAALFTKLFKLLQKHSIGVPPHLAAALRAIGTLDGTLKLVDPKFDLIIESENHSQLLMRKAISPEAIGTFIQASAVSIIPSLQRLPSQLRSVQERLDEGTFGVQVRQFAEPTDRAFLRNLVHEVIVAGISITAIIGSILLLGSTAGPMLTPSLRLYEFLGYTLALGGFVFGLRSLVRVFASKN
ncbi:hypothetical protein AL755_03440 (plasmid) [Arthrobacter sp. ERGS1:01]|nr:hypothetical protein AL755_03440 [Arthrobacter sp. ERGS1:01]